MKVDSGLLAASGLRMSKTAAGIPPLLGLLALAACDSGGSDGEPDNACVPDPEVGAGIFHIWERWLPEIVACTTCAAVPDPKLQDTFVTVTVELL